MKVSRFEWEGGDPAVIEREIRALQPALGEVSEAVAEIVQAVEDDGDAGVLSAEEQFGGIKPKTLRVPDDERKTAIERVPEDLLAAMRVSIQNVRSYAETESEGGEWGAVGWSQGPMLSATNVPVEAAGAYVPGGTLFSYPSTAIMCCVPAASAGVERISIATPPGPDGSVDSSVLAACSLAGATEVFAMGGAQAIAALGLGTESVSPVDIVVGPGNRYVQEAKRQIVGRAGIDGIAGPSELMVFLDRTAELRWIALDLCAQAEHADDGLLVVCAQDSGVLDELEQLVQQLASERETVHDAALALVELPSPELAVQLANALAPEHLQLVCADADQLVPLVWYAGCVFTGRWGATAFGDYAAGSNHVLPTGGAGRYQGPLSPRTFTRRITTVRISESAARELAPTVATLARVEGFPVHGESVEARLEEDRGDSP